MSISVAPEPCAGDLGSPLPPGMAPSPALSSDYLNLFNEIVVVLRILPQSPEMVDELNLWAYRSYADYFENSPLPFAGKALEDYLALPQGVRARFDEVVRRMRDVAEEAKLTLSRLIGDRPVETWAYSAVSFADRLQELMAAARAFVRPQIPS